MKEKLFGVGVTTGITVGIIIGVLLTQVTYVFIDMAYAIVPHGGGPETYEECGEDYVDTSCEQELAITNAKLEACTAFASEYIGRAVRCEMGR